MAQLLTEYQAAARVGMSPELLRWLAKYAPKQGDPRKLKIAKEERELVFFDETELEKFNAWLGMPWPHKDGSVRQFRRASLKKSSVRQTGNALFATTICILARQRTSIRLRAARTIIQRTSYGCARITIRPMTTDYTGRSLRTLSLSKTIR